MTRLQQKLTVWLTLTLILLSAGGTVSGEENPLEAYTTEELWIMARRLEPNTLIRMRTPYRGIEARPTSVPVGMAFLQQTRHSVTTHFNRPSIVIDEDAELKIAILQEILTRDLETPWFDLAHYELGLTYFILRRFEESISHWETASSSSNILQGRTLGDFALAYEYVGALDQAEAVLRKALEQQEDHPLRFQLALLLEKQNRFTEAVELYRHMLEAEDLYPYARDIVNQRVERVMQLQRSGQRLGSVRGKVLVNGEGAVGVEVFIAVDSNIVSSNPYVLESTFTRENGEFELYGVPAGSYRLGIFAPTHLVEGSSVQFVPALIVLEPGEQARAEVQIERRSVIIRLRP